MESPLSYKLIAMGRKYWAPLLQVGLGHFLSPYRSNNNKKKGKLQITLLKFRSVWILHSEISEFGFYLLNFTIIWILFPKIWD